MVNLTCIIYHHVSHGKKVYAAKNEIKPEKYLVNSFGDLLISLSLQLLCTKNLQEVDHLSEHSSVLL